MKLKLDANGNAVLVDGKPVYVYDDGKEVPFDAPGAMAKIAELNSEAKTHRLKREEAETKLGSFNGLNVDEAKKALEVLENQKGKKMIEAGEVEKLKADIASGWQKKLDDTQKIITEKESLIHNLVVSNHFRNSKYLQEKVVVPLDMIESVFGKHFKVEDGKLVSYDDKGNRISSRAKPGEAADFEEAMETIVNGYPHKDKILRGSGATGGGKPPDGSGSGASAFTLTSAQARDVNTYRTAKAAAEKAGTTVQIID